MQFANLHPPARRRKCRPELVPAPVFHPLPAPTDQEIAHILEQIPHKKVKREKVELPKRSMKDAYDDQKSIARRRFVAETY